MIATPLNDTNSLFPELNPADRIRKIIETYIYPDLEKLGFKMQKSTLSITRKVNDLKQEIYFPKSKWNAGNEVVIFEVSYNVTYPKYMSWHLKTYHKNALNDAVTFKFNYNVKEYFGDYYNYGFDLAKHDNLAIVSMLKTYIFEHAIPYFERASLRNAVLDTLASQTSYWMYPKLFDFACIENDLALAKQVLDTFDDFIENEKDEFPQEIIEDIELRKNFFVLNKKGN